MHEIRIVLVSILILIVPCRFTTDCEQVSNAIGYLENHTSADCRARGSAARSRFNNTTNGSGFSYGDGATNHETGSFDMYALVNYSNPFGGYTTGVTYINANGMIQLMEIMAGLVAHEEVHHAGQDDLNHDQNVAYPTQQTCSQSTE
ncbi:MAG: hypothetical protein ABJC26_00020 [Gemmatimonadaceae bacterium]